MSKDEYGAISDHLRSHVHLTNCIHLKNHMHRHSPNPAERSLMRDLIVLQKSRSLRDPSTSPSSWLSPYIVGSSYAKRPAKDGGAQSGRRSLGVDGRTEVGRLSTSSPQATGVATSRVAAAGSSSYRKIEGRDIDFEMNKGEEHSRSRRSNISHESDNPPEDLSQKVETKDKRISQRATHGQGARLKTLSEQLEEVVGPTDDERRNPSHLCQHRRHTGEEKIHEEPEASSYGHCTGSNRGKKRRFKGGRRACDSTDSRSAGAHNKMSTDSKSLAQVSMNWKGYVGEGSEEDAELEFARVPRHVCGIPWNWSRIHDRGQTFLDMAGRSLSCGLSDSRLRKAQGPVGRSQGNTSNMPQIASDHLSSSTSSDSEALPLLVEALGSQHSGSSPYLAWDYSGELGIFSNHGLRHEDSDLASEARSGNQQKSRGCRHGRHRSLTQKYMPKTFKDLVGQNLVVQALSNAVLRKKVGLIYVFYGPHGTGKTSCARVFAKALNCQSVEHLKPCDACASCISHNLGKSRNVLEVGPVGNFDFESIMDVLDNAMLSPSPSQYRVFILDDCDTLPPNSWSVISKIIDQAPRHVVFIFVSSNLDHLPHIIISRCQKFLFPKLKDSDVISTLQWISTSEGLEIDKAALKLIASRSDGSLRDAEMTLDQLSLLGQRISLPLVQELVGLVSDERLVDLLDLALSANTVNTVKSLREIMETGVEPLALMSQLATIITDILAGSYVFTQGRLRRKFFRRLTLPKKDMEKLRQALKTLSEAEKQLRVSNDKLTWLTAALLQLAPDQQYILPSSADASLSNSPLVLNNFSDRYKPRNFSNEQDEMHICDRNWSRGNAIGSRSSIGGNDVVRGNGKMIDNHLSGMGHGEHTPCSLMLSGGASKAGKGYNYGKTNKDNEKIWRAVLESVQSSLLRQFLSQEGRLSSVSQAAAPTVQLLFSSHINKSKAEKFRGQILQAFESVLSSGVKLDIRCESRKDVKSDVQNQHVLPAPENYHMTRRQSVTNQSPLYPGSEKPIRRLPKENGVKGIGSSQARWLDSDPHVMADGENIETGASSLEHGNVELTNNSIVPRKMALGGVSVVEASSLQHQGNLVPHSRESDGQYRRQSLVRGKVSLAHVIQQAEGCSQRGGWSRHKAISIAEKLEQENLRLEPRSRCLLCRKASRITRAKLSNLRIRKRKPQSLLKLVTCGRCLRARSPSLLIRRRLLSLCEAS
ncbi:protein STICHEL-like 4 isoform X2 [Phoenix dactylifera]|uniref:Protein STICHEL-like 4 isoform X2 n=1 Tax=Phoenix dactylifera TaxID=42345 RepID=A0A8B8J0I5_PHODC|nr:protein STICHEL-like 4 isoform X2 [Phoenix dactylifera]